MTPLTLAKTSALLIATMSLVACASGPKRGGQGSEFTGVSAHPVGLYFVGLDSNGDGATDNAELEAGIKADWAMFDRNPSAAQFQTWTVKALGSSGAMPSFLSFDSNLNGVVTLAEFETRLTGEFNRLDRNDDGQLTRSELVFTVQSRQRGERGSNQRGGEQGQRGGRPPR